MAKKLTATQERNTDKLMAFLRRLGACAAERYKAVRRHQGRTLRQAWFAERSADNLAFVCKHSRVKNPLPCSSCGPSCWYQMTLKTAKQFRAIFGNKVPAEITERYNRARSLVRRKR